MFLGKGISFGQRLVSYFMPLNSKIDVAKVRSHLIPISGAHGRKFVPVAPNLRETIALLSSCSKNVKSQPVTSFSILGFHSGSDFPKGVTVSPCQSVLQRTLGAVRLVIESEDNIG